MMQLPYRVAKGGWQNWAGRIVLFGGVGLFMYRAVTEWSRSGHARRSNMALAGIPS